MPIPPVCCRPFWVKDAWFDPPVAAERCMYIGSLNPGTFPAPLNIGSYSTQGGSLTEWADGMQANITPDSGVLEFGGYYIWLMLTEAEYNATQADGGTYYIDLSDPLNPVNVPVDLVVYDPSCGSSVATYRASFTVPDASVWFLNYIETLISNANVTSPPYSDAGFNAYMTAKVAQIFGANASFTFQLNGNDVVLTIIDTYLQPLNALSDDGAGNTQLDPFVI